MNKPAKRLPIWKKMVFSLVMLLLIMGILEGGLRIIGFNYEPRQRKLWKPTVSGFEGTYEFYIPTDFAPPGYIWISKPNTPYTDSYGFRRPEIPIHRVPGKTRVAFMGGSTTHGGYRPYPERAIRIINNALGTNQYEMLNVACSSYSTHQSLIALERWVLPRKPDIVTIYHGWNDQWVQEDGFSDSEKDFLLKTTEQIHAPWLAKVRNLSVSAFVGKIVDALDFTWPRCRVGPENFEKNLRRMISICNDADIKVILVVLPESRRRPLPERSPVELDYYSNLYDTEDLETIYNKNHLAFSRVQREVASDFPDTEICDAETIVNNLQDQLDRGEFGEDIQIFRQDAVHLFEIGDELFAQQVARLLAPQHVARINAYVSGYEYNAAIAREFLSESLPFASVFFAHRAIEAADTDARKVAMTDLIREAESMYEFARLFRQACWIGSEKDVNKRITMIKKCLELRPDDYGTMVQAFRDCAYSGNIDRLADTISSFQPANINQRYEWLVYLLRSHVAGQRYRNAEATARAILAINPNDPEAREFLRQAASP